MKPLLHRIGLPGPTSVTPSKVTTCVELVTRLPELLMSPLIANGIVEVPNDSVPPLTRMCLMLHVAELVSATVSETWLDASSSSPWDVEARLRGADRAGVGLGRGRTEAQVAIGAARQRAATPTAWPNSTVLLGWKSQAATVNGVANERGVLCR